MPSPENAAARLLEEKPGGAVQKNHADSASLRATYNFTRGRRRTRLARQDTRRKASRDLDGLLATMYPDDASLRHSENWERACANDLVAQGFDPEYVARRFGLTRRTVAA